MPCRRCSAAIYTARRCPPIPSFTSISTRNIRSSMGGADAELMKKAKEFGMPAVAITDHGNLYGAIEFYQAGDEGRDQADHRLRGVHGAGFDQGPAEQSARRGVSFHSAGEGRDRLPQPREARSPPRTSTACITSRGSTRNCSPRTSTGLIGMSGCLKGEINMAIQSDQSREGAAERGASSATSSARRISSSRCTITGSRRSKVQPRAAADWRRSSASAWSRRTTCISSSAAITKRTTS